MESCLLDLVIVGRSGRSANALQVGEAMTLVPKSKDYYWTLKDRVWSSGVLKMCIRLLSLVFLSLLQEYMLWVYCLYTGACMIHDMNTFFVYSCVISHESGSPGAWKTRKWTMLRSTVIIFNNIQYTMSVGQWLSLFSPLEALHLKWWK